MSEAEHFHDKPKATAEELFGDLNLAHKGVIDDLRYRYLAEMKDGTVQAIRARSALEAYKVATNRDQILRVKRELLDRIEMVEKSRMETRPQRDLNLPIFKSTQQLIQLEDFEKMGINIQQLSDIMGENHSDFDTPVVAAVMPAPVIEENVVALLPDTLAPEDAVIEDVLPMESAPAQTEQKASEEVDMDGLTPEEIERLLNG